MTEQKIPAQAAGEMDGGRLVHGLAIVAMVAGFGLPGVMPEVANVTYIGLAIVGLGLLWAQGPAYRKPLAVAMPLLACLLLLIAAVASNGVSVAVLPVFAFVPVCLYVGFATILRTPAIGMVAATAAAGCVAALGVAVYDAYVLGLPGPGASVNNPIHFANIALTLSFVSLAGVYDRGQGTRWIAIGGCVAGIAAMWISGARGPVIALPVMLGLGGLILLWQGLPRWRMATMITVPALSLLALWLIWYGRVLDVFGPFSDLMLLLREGVITDHSTWERVTLYQSAWNALMASPVYGHGLDSLAATALDYAPNGATFPLYDHLHSDLADFAVGGGGLGLLALVCLWLTPLVGANWRGQGLGARVSVFLAVTISSGYMVMGLTNATFGLLSQTVLYGAVTALIVRMGAMSEAEPVTGNA